MFVPKIFRAPDLKTVENYVRQHPFATLVSTVGDAIKASHIPLYLDRPSNSLLGHIAKGNELEESLGKGHEFLAIFMDLHAYVSSSWYERINVPTWNYIAVHIYGKPEIMEGEDLYNSLHAMVGQYEKGRNSRFELENMPEKMLHANMNGIIGFRLSIDRIEAAFKLSQNRNEKDYTEIIKRLESESDPLSTLIAAEMKNLNP